VEEGDALLLRSSFFITRIGVMMVVQGKCIGKPVVVKDIECLSLVEKKKKKL